MAEITRSLYRRLQDDGFSDLPDIATFEKVLSSDIGVRQQLYKALKVEGYTDLPDYPTFDRNIAGAIQQMHQGELRNGKAEPTYNPVAFNNTPDPVPAGMSAMPDNTRVVVPGKPEDISQQQQEPPDSGNKGFWATTGDLALQGLDRASTNLMSAAGAVIPGRDPVEMAVMARREAERKGEAMFPYSNTRPNETFQSALQKDGIANKAAAVIVAGIQGAVQSAPEMVLAAGSPPAFILSMTEDIANSRAQSRGKRQAGLQERAEALPFALGSYMLEKVGIEGLTGKYGTDIAVRIGDRLIQRFGKNIGNWLVRANIEGLTEVPQEWIEYTGEVIGTGAPVDPLLNPTEPRFLKEGQRRGLEGFGTGLFLGGTVGGVNQALQPSPERQIANAIDQQVEQNTPISSTPIAHTREMQAPAMRDYLEAALRRRGLTLDADRQRIGVIPAEAPATEQIRTQQNEAIQKPQTQEEQPKAPEAGLSAEPQGKVQQEVEKKEPQKAKNEPDTPYWEMGAEALREREERVAQADKDAEVEVFGEEGAKKYKRLLRLENSRDFAKADQASNERVAMENALTEAQRNRLFGIDDPAAEDIEIVRAYRQAVENARELDPEDTLARVFVTLGGATDPAKMNFRQRLAWAQAKEVMRNSHGVNQAEVLENAFKKAAKRFSDPKDAEFMLRPYLDILFEKKQKAPAQKHLHGPQGTKALVPTQKAEESLQKAEREVDTTPTDAQKAAGNYKKGHVNIHGLDITIENPKGSERSGTDNAGKKWSVKMKHTYGYFKRTEGNDGDQVDVFIGDDLESQKIYVVDQIADGKFDEHKVMMGFPTINDAKAGYLANYEKGWNGLGEITEMSVDEFKTWLDKGSQKKPVRWKPPEKKRNSESEEARSSIKRAGEDVAIFAGGKDYGKARHALVELEDLIVSHDPEFFTPNPKYPQDRQPRDYRSAEVKARAKEIIGSITKGEFASYFQKNIESETGMPVINRDGIVLSGNNRSMAVHANYDVYRKALNKQRLSAYGISTIDLQGLKKPVLVRVFDDASKENDFANDSNKEITKASTAGEVVKVYESLSEERREIAKKGIQGLYEMFAESGRVKINEFLAAVSMTDLPTKTREFLTESGILSRSDIQGNQFTSVGQEKVKSVAAYILNQDMRASQAVLDKITGKDEVSFGVDRSFDLAIGPILRMKDKQPGEYAGFMRDLGAALNRYIDYQVNAEMYKPGKMAKGNARKLSAEKAKRGLSVDQEPLTKSQERLFDALNSTTQSSLSLVANEIVVGQETLFSRSGKSSPRKGAKTPSSSIASEIETQLTRLPQYTEEQRKAAGAFVQAFYDTKAKQLGISSDELYKMLPYKIEAGDVEGAGLLQRGDAMNDSSSRNVKSKKTGVTSEKDKELFQFDLFDDFGVSGTRGDNTEQASDSIPGTGAIFRDDAPGRYATRTRLVKERTRRIGANRIIGPSSAAQALSGLSTSAVERVEVIVTDKQGRPIAITGASKGDRSQASFFVYPIISEIMRLNSAASIWIGHNHPSGDPRLSGADRRVADAFIELLEGSGIAVKGVFAVGGSRSVGKNDWEFYDPSTGLTDAGVTDDFAEKMEIPVVERIIDSNGSLVDTKISQLNIFPVAEEVSEGASGIMFLTTKLGVVGFMPIQSTDEAVFLRTEGRMNAVMRAASISNAARAVIVNNGELSDDAVKNVSGLLNSIDIEVVDSVNPKTKESWYAGGSAALSNKVFRQRSNNVRGGFSPERLTTILNKKSDFSTFVHETGHAYLEMTAAIASQKGVPKQVKFDMDVLLKWFGVKDLDTWNAMTLEEKRKFHEAFAYNFELYVSEGKAPNAGLRGVFERFKKWLGDVYNNIKSDLNAAYRKETGEDLPVLTGEVREVMERMIAGKSQRKVPSGVLNASFSPGANYKPHHMSSPDGLPDRPENGIIWIGGRRVELPSEENPQRLESVRLLVQKIIGARLYFGKVKGATSRQGFYRERNASIRVRNFKDVAVLAHEMAHFLGEYYPEKNLFNKAYRSPEFADELEGVSYTKDKRVVFAEGFAEFVRLWLTQYDSARSAAPKFTVKFEQVLAHDAKLQTQLTVLQEAMHKWYFQGDMARLEAVTGGNKYTIQEKITKWLAQRPTEMMRQQIVDNIHAAKVMERETTGTIGDAEESPYKQLQLLNGVEGIIQESFLHGAPYINSSGEIAFRGPSLEQVWGRSLKEGPKAVRAQEKYFVAKRAAELRLQGRENLIDEGMILAGQALEKKYSWFEQAFKDYQEYNKNLVAFMVKSGYIEPKAATQWQKANQNYVPFNREVEGINEAFAGSGNLKRLKGGTQNIKHVYDNILQSSASHIKGALRARAMRSLYMTALSSPEGGQFITDISKDAKKVRSSIEQQAKVVSRAMSELGLTISKNGMILSGSIDADQITDVEEIEQVLVDHPEMLEFWTFGHKPATAETGVDSFIDPKTGKRKYVEIQKDNEILLDMIGNASGARIPDGPLGALIRAAIQVKQFQTVTITAAWQFALPNIVRDMQSAVVLSGGKFRPVVDNLQGIASMLHDLVKQEGWYHEMKSQGGGWSGRVRSIMTDSIQLQRGPMVPKYRSGRHPVSIARTIADILISVGDFAEMSTRVGFYIRQRKSGTSARESAWQAREISTDFRKHGSYSAWVIIQRMAPFLGAYVQSMDRDIRALGEVDGKMELSKKQIMRLGRAKARIYAAGGLMMSTGILLALMNGDDDRYQDLTPDQKARFYHLFFGDRHITIPKAHGFFSLMMNAGEALVDKLKGQSGEDAGKYIAFSMAYQFGQDIMPGFADPVVGLALNRTFTGAPIIPQSLEGVDPEYQFRTRTPAMYINIGQAMGISPLAAEHLVRGYTGYVADFVNEATERALWDREKWGSRPFPRDLGDFIGKQFKPFEGRYRTKYAEKYYALRREAAEKNSTYSRLQKAPLLRDPAMFERYVDNEENLRQISLADFFSGTDKLLSDAEMKIATIKYDKQLSQQEKESRIIEYYEKRNAIYKSAVRELERAIK